jgi:hypothetical protein
MELRNLKAEIQMNRYKKHKTKDRNLKNIVGIKDHYSINNKGSNPRILNRTERPQ